MRRQHLTALMATLLVVKVSFIWRDDTRRQPFLGSKPMEPTYRISWQVYPRVHRPKITMAMSETNKDGTLSPKVIATVMK